MNIVLIISWLRFFSYFLVINLISRLTITFIRMLKEAFPFIIIIACYMILMTTVFSTLFNSANPDEVDEYSTVGKTLITLLHYMVAKFEDKDMGNFQTSYTLLYMFHVIISNVFMVNFIAAII